MATTTTTTTTVAESKGRVQLPLDLKPTKYTLTLEPDLVNFTFKGDEVIAVDVVAATKSVSLHAKELAIQSVVFSNDEGVSVSPIKTILDNKYNTVEFVFENELPLGKGKLTFAYVGLLNDQMAGFYRSSYTAINGEKRIMASTQFESLDARRAFLCWDEPAVKSIFQVTLIVPADRTAFSNMPEEEQQLLKNGKKLIRFEPSPLMSTYLVAFCVGEFDFVQTRTNHGVIIRVYTPPGKAEHGLFSMDCAKRALDFYDDFFNIPYPLPKLDMVAIPEFAMGAMENWGLVTYREVDVLIDPAKASSQQKQRVCIVVTHELAHQWFGNLVTMAWWDDLWLNEGFASWCENFAADHLFPDWKVWEQFTNGHLASAMRLDALQTSHPIQVPIKHAEEVEEVFDAISYCKGASVVRMLHVFLGEEVFCKGIRAYMQKHKYKNTETVDLWQAWSEASGKPVKDIMASWTEQMGFPLLTVTNAEWKDKEVVLSLKQSWFLADGTKAGDNKLWSIPLVVGGSSLTTNTTSITSFSAGLMQTSEYTLGLPVSSSGPQDWIKLNFGQAVPMRVAYTPDMMARLANAVRTKSMKAEDRAGLLMDCFALSRSGHVSPAEVVKLMSAFADDDSSIVWDALDNVITGLRKVLVEDKNIWKQFEGFVGKLLKNISASVGWDSKSTDGHLGKLLRGTIISLLGTFSTDPAVLSEARKRFDALIANPEDATACPAEYKVPVFKMVLRAGGKAEYDALINLYQTAKTNAEKVQVLHAIGEASDPKLKKQVLEWTTSGEVKLQDFFYPMGSVSASGQVGRDMTFAFFQENFKKLHGMVARASPSLFDAVIVFCCGGFSSAEKANEVEQFFVKNPLPSNQRKISQVLENMRTNHAFLSRVLASDMSKESFWANL